MKNFADKNVFPNISDLGSFQINDVVLDIPPELIQTERRSSNAYWQTLRTRSSTKTKSGFSTLNVSIQARFTDEENPDTGLNSFSKLRDLISQVRVTPFCYVENKKLRDVIEGGNENKNMALVLRQMELSTDPSAINIINVMMRFSWFNYIPYIDNFVFKKSIFEKTNNPVTNPKDSYPYRLLYRAEQKRGNYTPAPEEGKLNSSLDFSVKVFKASADPDYKSEETKYLALQSIGQDLNSVQDGESNVSQEIKIRLSKIADDNPVEFKKLFGNESSMTPKSAMRDIKRELDPRETSTLKTYLNWYESILDGKKVSLPMIPGETVDPDKKGPKETGGVLLEKWFGLKSLDEGLIPTHISLSFENIVSTIPLTGHTYPTFQHIGSTDAHITISFLTTEDEAVRRITEFCTRVENQAQSYKWIPQGQRNIHIKNQILNMCGYHEFLLEDLSTSTVKGQPGTSQVILQLVDDSVDTSTREKLAQEQQIFSDGDINRAILKRFEKDLALIPMWKPPWFKYLPKISKTNVRAEMYFTALKEYSEALNDFIDRTIDECDLRINKVPSHLGKKESYALSAIPEVLGYFTADAINVLENLERSGVTRIGKKTFIVVDGLDIYKKRLAFERLSDSQVAGMTLTKNVTNKLGVNNWLELTTAGTPVMLSISESTFDLAVDTLKTEGEAIINFFNNPLSVFSGEREKNTLKNIWKFINPVSPDKIRDINSRPLEQVATKFKKENWVETWLNKQSNIVNKFVRGGGLTLPEFEDLQKDFAKLNMGFKPQSQCYPDFPIDHVIEILREEKKDYFNEVQQTVDSSTKDVLKNIGINAFIDPDFYFYGNLREKVEEIVSPEMLNVVKRYINDSSASREKAEMNWIEKIHNKKVLSEEGKKRVQENYNKIRNRYLEKAKNSPAAKEAHLAFESQAERTKNLLMPLDFYSTTIKPGLQEIYEVGKTEKEKTLILRDHDNKDLLHSKDRPKNQKMEVNQEASSITHKFSDIMFSDFDEFAVSDIERFRKENSLWLGFDYPLKKGTFVEGDKVKLDRTVKGVRRPHKGTDLKCPIGTFVYPSATGVIVRIKYGPSGFGWHIIIKHMDPTGKNPTPYYTVYGHLEAPENNPLLMDLIEKLATEDMVTLVKAGVGSTLDVYSNFSISKTDYIAEIQKGGPRVASPSKAMALSGRTGRVTGPHLHFELWEGIPNVEGSFYIDPIEAINKKSTILFIPDKAVPSSGTPSTGGNLLNESAEILDKSLKKDAQIQSMMRAYPAFKLFFIDSDLGKRRYFAFDDFFNYSAVKEIQVIRSRKIAADLAIIQLTNVSGVLSNRKFLNNAKAAKFYDKDGKPIEKESLANVNTINENPIASMMLQAGVQVQLRLGYSNDPDELETVLNGFIQEVNFSQTDDLVTIVCQSFGTELIQTIIGEVRNYGAADSWFLDDDSGLTIKIIEDLLTAEELTHFGRWEKDGDVNTALPILTNRWSFKENPADDNIFAPAGKGLFGGDTPGFKIIQTTIWDVLQELTFRHPGMICSTVPYEGKYGPRMTVFFGVPDQLYFARDPSLLEDNHIDQLIRIGEKARKKLAVNTARDSLANKTLTDSEGKKLGQLGKEVPEEVKKKLVKEIGLERKFIRPFRNYHVLTGTHHIIYNNIKNAAYNTFNTVTIEYETDYDGPDEVDKEDRTKGSSPLSIDDLGTLTMKADAGIDDEDVREVFVTYPNANGQLYATRYALSLLKNSLKEGYRGSIVVIGNPSIKPYDICYIFDEYNDLVGPIEVEQVVHKFSQKNGFITEITPDMIVHVNELSTMATVDAMGMIAGATFLKTASSALEIDTSTMKGNILGRMAQAANYANPLGWLSLGLLRPGASDDVIAKAGLGEDSTLNLNPYTSTLGVFLFRKLFSRTQTAHPFRYSPLLYKGRPLLGGLGFVKKTKGDLVSRFNKWFVAYEEGKYLYAEEFFDTIDPRNWVNNQSGSFWAWTRGEETT